jgi:hypothetical protein
MEELSLEVPRVNLPTVSSTNGLTQGARFVQVSRAMIRGRA